MPRTAHLRSAATSGAGMVLACACVTVPAATIPTTATFAVGATVQSGCLVSGNPTQTTGLVFGQIAFGTWSALTTGAQTVALGPAGGSQALLQCTAGTTVQVSIDGGLHALGTQRRLSNGGGYFLPYTLSLTTSGNLPLLPDVPLGVALGTTAQALPLQGTVLMPGLGLVAGTYTDTVQVTVSW